MQLHIDFSGVNAFTIFFSILAGFLPSFVWLLFYLKEDMHPVPRRLVASTFLMGMASAAVALIAETILNISILPAFGIARLSIISLIVVSLIEESTKFGAAYISVNKSPYFNEPVGAMIYAVTAALGFAAIENLGAIAGVSSAQGVFLTSVFHITSLRFVGATLLHALASAIVGYFWALDIRDFKLTKYIYIGLAAATILHTIFNYLIIQYDDLMYLLVFLSIAGFFILSDFEKLKRKVI